MLRRGVVRWSSSESIGQASAVQQRMEALAATGRPLYPHLAPRSSAPDAPRAMRIAEFRALFGGLAPGARAAAGASIELCGRVLARREASKKLVFYTLCDGDDPHASAVQVMATAAEHRDADASFDALHRSIGRGDIVRLRGVAGKTKTGELSLIPSHATLLAPCLQPLPDAGGLTDAQLRMRHRHVDLLLHADARAKIRARAALLRALRASLHERGFLEVETPILSRAAGGALARPFVTHADAGSGSGGGTRLHLRIAPELYLKRAVIGGFARVFEIGKVFRNEGVSAHHNPEFTSCEAYQAFASYADLLPMTEAVLRELVTAVRGSLEPLAVGDAAIDFGAPFAQIDVVPALAERLGCEVPLPAGPDDRAALARLDALCTRAGIECASPRTATRLVDKLIGALLEPSCVQPTFLMHPPLFMSPLAKALPDRPHLAQRFELFVAGKELVNAYSELNDPREQRARFAAQAADRAAGDAEVPEGLADEEYCAALEWGLPPTAGWGLGVDRLAMLLTGAPHIREVLLFRE